MSGVDERARRAGADLRVRAQQVEPRPVAPMSSPARTRVIAAAAVVVVAIAVAALVVNRHQEASPAARRADVAETMVSDLAAGRFESVRRQFDAGLGAALSTSEIRTAWTQVTGIYGAYRSHGESVRKTSGSQPVVEVPLRMADSPAVFRAWFDADGKVSGIFFVRPGVAIGDERKPLVADDHGRAAADAVVTALKGGDFARVVGAFDNTMRRSVTEARLEAVWGHPNATEAGDPLVRPSARTILYDYPITLDGRPSHVQVSIDENGRVGGLVVKPGPPTGVPGQ